MLASTPYMYNRGHRPPPNTSLLIFFSTIPFLEIFNYLKNPKTNPPLLPPPCILPLPAENIHKAIDMYRGIAKETGSNKRRPKFLDAILLHHGLPPPFSQAIAVAMPPCDSQKTSETTDQPPQLMRSDTHPTSGPPIAAVASPETAPSLLSLSNTLARRARPDSTLCTGSSSPPPKGTSSGSRLAM